MGCVKVDKRSIISNAIIKKSNRVWKNLINKFKVFANWKIGGGNTCK